MQRVSTAPGQVRIYRKPDVQQLTGLSDSTLRRMMRRGEFPLTVKIGVRSVGWRSDAIDAWIHSRESSTGNVSGQP